MNKLLVFFICFVIFCLVLSYFSFSQSESKTKVVSESYDKNTEGKIRVIVKLKDIDSQKGFKATGKQPLAHIKEMKAALREDVINVGGKENIRHRYSSINAFSADLTKEEINRLIADGRVESIKESKPKHLFLQDSVGIINATRTWQLQINGTNLTGIGQTVCVIDTGVKKDHADLNGKVIAEYCFCGPEPGYRVSSCCPSGASEEANATDENGHGTHVSGIIAANGNLRGVAPGANLVVIRVFGADELAFDDDLNSAIDWCTDNSTLYNISAISMSLGGGQYSSYCDVNSAQTDFINAAVAKNISVVVATGNTGATYTNRSGGVADPACVFNSTRVSAVDKSDDFAYYAFRGINFPDILLAPGGDNSINPSGNINSTWYDGAYEQISGTSMAAPHVSGAIAAINQYLRIYGLSRTPAQVNSLLNTTGKRINDSGYTNIQYSRINLFAAVLSLDNIAPNMQFTNNSPANNSYTNLSSAIINITSDEILTTAFIELNNVNTTMNGSLANWWISINANGSFSYIVYGRDNAANTGQSERRLINLGNIAPAINNISIASSDNMNRSNGTITAIFSLFDGNNDNLTNETRWYNNSVLVNSFSNLSYVNYTCLRKNQNWNFSVRAFDGTNYSSWQNATITINNAPPEIQPIANITVNESDQLNITVNATDIDGDILNYTINNGNFSLLSFTFVWNTTVNDSGSYTFNITVNDSESISSILAYATINDMPDIDGDGIPDYKDTDNDNDGINNTIDYLLGNASNLNTTIANISIFINSSNNISQIFNTTLLVNITSGNSTLVVFNWSFSNSSVLNLYNVTIARQANTSNNGSLLIRGIALPQNQTKTAYMDRIANISYVCIKDAEINSIANISSGCNGTNEFFISCNASLQGQYSCNTTANNLSYIITGINNSGIREQCRDNDNDGYGTGCSLGTDCNDNNANIHPGASETCGNGVDENCDGSDTACASSSSSSGGGGGGIKNDENTLSNSFLYMKPNEKYILSGKRASLAVTKILFYVNNAVIRGQLTANITNITALAENNIPPVENPYQYFQVTPSASIKGNIANAEIEFRIINSWFTNFPDISKGKIKLLRYSTSWETYYSNLVKEDINYTYYSVSVPGFSYFAVAGDKISEKPTENKTVQKETKKIVEITENKSASARIEPTAEKAKLQKEEKANYKSLMLILIIICVFILIILIIFKRSSRRKDNKEEFKKKELKPKV